MMISRLQTLGNGQSRGTSYFYRKEMLIKLLTLVIPQSTYMHNCISLYISEIYGKLPKPVCIFRHWSIPSKDLVNNLKNENEIRRQVAGNINEYMELDG